MKACRDCQFFVRQGEHYGQCKRLGAMKDDAGGYFLDSPTMLVVVQDDLRQMVASGERRAELGIPSWGYITVPEFFLCAYFCVVEPEIAGQREAKENLDSAAAAAARAAATVFHDFGWPIGEQRYKARTRLGDDMLWIEPGFTGHPEATNRGE